MLKQQFAAAILFALSTTSAFADETSREQSPWSMSVAQFRSSLDQAIRIDSKNGLDGTTKHCKLDSRDKSTTVCDFADENFQYSMKAMKQYNWVDGHFKQDLSVRLSADHGKLTKIALIGDRSDPMNLMEFFSTAIDILQVFDKDIVAKDDDFRRVRDKLGLLRGDDAPDIGEPRTMIEDWGVIHCLASPSEESTKVMCVVRPRS
jgi:hypothetical protein